ncbi:DinB family protein [Hymenobacter sediminicola]|uniref:DinB family protein n=1 Tax=Hymenobacter sediminicola TaxID=2761579 RepID=A0A7G7W6Y9_9BACT|nr:DinB family protein [Hymenobacter sediminicola]
MHTPKFLQHLRTNVRSIQTLVETELLPLPEALLNGKPAPERWSALECVEHLNRYCRYYNPALARALRHPAAARAEVQYSWLGRKSLDMVRPGSRKQHKTVKHMNPAGSLLTVAVLQEFLQHQKQLAALLQQAATADLNRKAVPVEFFRLLKLRTGEALEFVVLHEQRHVQQALRDVRQAQEAAL